MDSFEAVRARLERRQRFLQGLEAMSWTALGTVGLTALVLVLSLLRVVPMPPVLGLAVGNILLAAVAFGVGWCRRFAMTEMLWNADRNARCHERLVTVYELKSGRGATEFLPLLERRLEGLSLDVAQALPLESSERRRWVGVLVLAVLCLAPFTVKEIFTERPEETKQPTATASSTSSPLLQQSPIADLVPPPPPELAHKIPLWRKHLEQARTALAQNPNDPRARALLEQLHAEISQAQDRLRTVPGADAEPPRSGKPDEKASVVENPPGEVRTPNRDERPHDPTELDRLLQDLQSLQDQAQELSPEEMQKLFEQLRQNNPRAATLVERALSGGSRALREQLGEILKNLQQSRELAEQLDQLQREVSQSQPQTARSPEQTPSPSATSSGDSPSHDDQNAPGSAESIAGSKPSGGRGTVPLDPEAAKDLPDLSALRERTRSLSVPVPQDENLQILFEIISTGLPQSTGPASPTSPVHIDYQKVETLLDTLEIPAELRDAVRKYFLSLAHEGSP